METVGRLRAGTGARDMSWDNLRRQILPLVGAAPVR